ncbi:acyl-CoA thioesterase, partial [Dispira parvispora]
LDHNLYRSTGELWVPPGGRGVFGGQVVAQALAAASNTVPNNYRIHSLHSYFVQASQGTMPILYQVERVREGTTFCTRIVKAIQRGQCCFSLMCSFQAPRENGPVHQEPMPDVPPPEALLSDSERFQQWANSGAGSYAFYSYAKVKAEKYSPAEIRLCNPPSVRDTLIQTSKPPRTNAWIRFKEKLDSPSCYASALAYCSDFLLVVPPALPHGLTVFSNPRRLALCVSLDHSIWFHAPFDPNEWLLYSMQSPRTADGRGLAFGYVYNQSGTLVATISQECTLVDHDTPSEFQVDPITLLPLENKSRKSVKATSGKVPQTPKARL